MSEGSPRKVCHLRATNFFGGPEKQILEHCRELETSAWRGIIAVFREGREEVELEARARAAGLETFQIETSSSFSPRAVGLLRRELESRKIDLLVTHGYKSDIIGRLALRHCRTPQLIHMRGFTGENWKVRLYEHLDLWALRRVQGVICVSEATRHLLIARGVSDVRAVTVHNAIHAEEQIKPIDLSEAFGLPQQARVLVAAGRLSPEKGHAVLIDAFSILARQNDDLQLLIVGDGHLAQELTRHAARLSCRERIYFPGFRNDALRCLAAGTLIVNPSFSEGLPNVILEAFVAQTPVVATCVGGVPELIEEGRTGYLAPPGDSEALAQAIETALANPNEARRRATRARELVLSAFTFPAQAEKLTAIYDRKLSE